MKIKGKYYDAITGKEPQAVIDISPEELRSQLTFSERYEIWYGKKPTPEVCKCEKPSSAFLHKDKNPICIKCGNPINPQEEKKCGEPKTYTGSLIEPQPTKIEELNPKDAQKNYIIANDYLNKMWDKINELVNQVNYLSRRKG